MVFHTSRSFLFEFNTRFLLDDARDHGRIVTHLNLNCKNRLKIKNIFGTKAITSLIILCITFIHKLLNYQHQIRAAINLWENRFLWHRIYASWYGFALKTVCRNVCFRFYLQFQLSYSNCVESHLILARFQKLNARHCLLQIVSC